MPIDVKVDSVMLFISYLSFVILFSVLIFNAMSIHFASVVYSF